MKIFFTLGAFSYDVRYLFWVGFFDLPTYPNQMIYYISLLILQSDAAWSTYLRNLTSYHMWMLPFCNFDFEHPLSYIALKLHFFIFYYSILGLTKKTSGEVTFSHVTAMADFAFRLKDALFKLNWIMFPFLKTVIT